MAVAMPCELERSVGRGVSAGSELLFLARRNGVGLDCSFEAPGCVVPRGEHLASVLPPPLSLPFLVSSTAEKEEHKKDVAQSMEVRRRLDRCIYAAVDSKYT